MENQRPATIFDIQHLVDGSRRKTFDPNNAVADRDDSSQLRDADRKLVVVEPPIASCDQRFLMDGFTVHGYPCAGTKPVRPARWPEEPRGLPSRAIPRVTQDLR